MMGHPNMAEDAWKGEIGNDYTQRQTLTLAARRSMFSDIVIQLPETPGSVIEFGANTGENLRAIKADWIPCPLVAGVEINETAFKDLKKVADVSFHESMLEFTSTGTWDLAFTRGVLIHIPPAYLPKAYEVLYRASRRYVLVCEYFSRRIEGIRYRGQDGLLWKGPYAYQMMDAYPDLKLIAYGFVSSRDPAAPQDDVTWFCMEKRGPLPAQG